MEFMLLSELKKGDCFLKKDIMYRVLLDTERIIGAVAINTKNEKIADEDLFILILKAFQDESVRKLTTNDIKLHLL